MYPTTADQVQQAITTQFTALLTQVLAWAQDESRTLAAIEQHILPVLHALGQTIVTGCAQLQAPAAPPRTIVCPCGQAARALRQRPATVMTVLGRIIIPRTYYHCPACRTGHYPLDAQLQICAGGRSAALDELLALLGATQDSFAQAASVLARLTLVQVSPSTVRVATEQLGTTLAAAPAPAAPPPALPPPARLYVAMDGVFAPLRRGPWGEIKVGCCYQTTTPPERTRPTQGQIHAHHLSYVAALAPAATFGAVVWDEAVRRGVLDAAEVVVISDGAHWIWNLAREQFPGATEIVDWYHASQYVWGAATAIWGETGAVRETWAHQQLDALWAGQVGQVLAALAQHRDAGRGVTDALSYYTTHQARMDYPTYRARGLQIGSGSVESACKQLVTARLKQAGMRWTVAGATAVATVRAWLKSDRWAEAMGLRPPPQRTYRRMPTAPAEVAPPITPPAPPAPGVPAEVLARVRAEEAQERAVHPWRRGWSVRQQQRDAAGAAGEPPLGPSA